MTTENIESPSSAPLVERSVVLEKLLAADLNPREIRFLLALAEAAPEPISYQDLLEVAGGGAKLGNVTAGLFRRWRSRGGTDDNAPWTDVDGVGRRLVREDATVIIARLSEAGSK